MFLDTRRCYLRELSLSDLDDVEFMLKEEDFGYTFSHEFSDEDIKKWIQDNINTYETKGLGMMAIILKEDDSFIGQAGLIKKDLDGNQVLDMICFLKKKYRKKGYGIETCKALRAYAFDQLKVDKLYSFIRDENTLAKNIAKKLDMHPIKSVNVTLYSQSLIQEVFVIDKEKYEKNCL